MTSLDVDSDFIILLWLINSRTKTFEEIDENTIDSDRLIVLDRL